MESEALRGVSALPDDSRYCELYSVSVSVSKIIRVDIMRVLWTASWCAPCGPLKKFVAEHYPHVKIMDIEEGVPKHLSIKSVPALQVPDKN